MNTLLDRISTFFLPTCCILCHQSQADAICKNCIEELTYLKAPRCTICATPSHRWVCKNCFRQPPAFDASHCISDIYSRLQIPIQNLRKHSSLHLINGVIRAWEILGGKNYPPVDLLIPVPLSTTTLAKRGFNQAWELCKQMSSHNKVSTSSRLLKKMNCRQDPPMGKLMRGRHLKQTFFLDEVELCKIGGLENKRVGVVDDLMDSGATLNAIATILKENGASWVSNWIILRTPSPELY